MAQPAILLEIDSLPCFFNPLRVIYQEVCYSRYDCEHIYQQVNSSVHMFYKIFDAFSLIKNHTLETFLMNIFPLCIYQDLLPECVSLYQEVSTCVCKCYSLEL